MATGKFQGVISETTPSGSRSVKHSVLGTSLCTASPHSRQPSPAMNSTTFIDLTDSPRASAMDLPSSRVIA